MKCVTLALTACLLPCAALGERPADCKVELVPAGTGAFEIVFPKVRAKIEGQAEVVKLKLIASDGTTSWGGVSLREGPARLTGVRQSANASQPAAEIVAQRGASGAPDWAFFLADEGNGRPQEAGTAYVMVRGRLSCLRTSYAAWRRAAARTFDSLREDKSVVIYDGAR